MKNKLDKQILDAMSKNPSNWKGPFYFNNKDPRLVVPKLNPYLGVTLNFASPYTYWTIGLVILFVIVYKLMI